ncbi:hypothetical protein BH10PSE18_BH10PSE18_14940 [soil metagenome]
MTYDLFSDNTPTTSPAPVRESFVMQPTGEPNRWTYRGVHVGCDMQLKGLIGHWFTTEPLGPAVVKIDLRVLLCRRIDAHFNALEGSSS